MATLNEIKARLNALAFAGRSYAGLDPRVATKECTQAVEAFDQTAITVAASELADAAVDVADRYAGNDAEALEIRLMIGDPVDKLINVAQGTAITPEEAGE